MSQNILQYQKFSKTQLIDLLLMKEIQLKDLMYQKNIMEKVFEEINQKGTLNESQKILQTLDNITKERNEYFKKNEELKIQITQYHLIVIQKDRKCKIGSSKKVKLR